MEKQFFKKKTRHIQTKHYAAKYINQFRPLCFDRKDALYYQKIYQRRVDFKLVQKLCEHVQSFSAQPVTIHDAVFANNLPQNILFKFEALVPTTSIKLL